MCVKRVLRLERQDFHAVFLIVVPEPTVLQRALLVFGSVELVVLLERLVQIAVILTVVPERLVSRAVWLAFMNARVED